MLLIFLRMSYTVETVHADWIETAEEKELPVGVICRSVPALKDTFSKLMGWVTA